MNYQFFTEASAACNYVPNDLISAKKQLKNKTDGIQILINELHPVPYRRLDKSDIQILSQTIMAEVKHSAAIKQHIRKLSNGTLDPSTKQLFSTYDRISKNASGYVEFLENITEVSNVLVSEIRSEIEEGIRSDQADMLAIALLTNEWNNNIVDFLDANLVLRKAAAYGARRLLNYLLSYNEIHPEVNLLAAAEGSKKTALHRAIENGQTVCVKILLEAELSPGQKVPVQQLLVGEKPNRPLDSLLRLKDLAKKVEILGVISVLNLRTEANISSHAREDLDVALASYQLQACSDQSTHLGGQSGYVCK